MCRRRIWPLVAAATIWLIVAGCGPDVPDEPCPQGDCERPRDTGTSEPDSGPSCSGCLFGSSGSCVKGTDDRACGSGGEVCEECADDEFCTDEGECTKEPCSRDNCDGCCYDGTCQPGVKDFACGTGGQRCGTCPEGKHCTPDGSCVDCSEGCWTEEGRCKEGTSPEACGTGGETCSSCSSENVCKEGACVEPAGDSCSQSCIGCCAGDQCKQGSAVHACGRDGEACQTCSDGFTCDSAGDCTVEDGSRWDVVAAEVTIVESTVDIDTGSGPDPQLEMTVGEDSGKTSKKENTYRVVWNEVVVEDATARGLKNDTSYTLWDNDLTGQEKIVADCDPGIGDENFANKKVEDTCIGGASARTRANFIFKLVPK